MATSGGPAREEGQLPGCRRLRVPGRHALRVTALRDAPGLARGWCAGRTASPRSPSPAFVSHSSPVVRVSPTHQLMRPRGPEGFSPVSSCRTAVPRSAAGAVRSSCPEPPRAHVRAMSPSCPDPPHTHVRTMSPSCPGPFRPLIPAPVVAQRLEAVGRRPTPYQPSLPPRLRPGTPASGHEGAASGSKERAPRCERRRAPSSVSAWSCA